MQKPNAKIAFPTDISAEMQNSIEVFQDYLEKEKNYSIHTRGAYLRDLKLFLSYCLQNKLDFLQMKRNDFENYFLFLKDKQKLEHKTRNRKLSSLRSFYSTLEEKAILANHLAKYIHYEEKNIPKEELPSPSTQLLEKRDKAILELLYSSGIRVYELVKAKIDELSSDLRSLRIPSNKNKARFVFLDENARKVLDEYLLARKDANLIGETIFLNQKGNKLTTRGIRYILNERKKLMGFDRKVTPHKFRYTFASDLLDAGENIKIVKELLGVKNQNNNHIYSNVNNERIREIYRKSHPHARNEPKRTK
ncbi:MAG: tyrosine-type recombinase/integrase [Spirochaetota bacterium]